MPDGDGRYVATIDPTWTLAMVPQGGVVAAIAARAMATELACGAGAVGDAAPQPLRSIHGVFVSPVPDGPVEVDVQVLRRGRSVSQVQATVHRPGAATGFTVIGAFGGERTGPATFTELVPPDVADPEELPSFRNPPPPEAGIEDWRVLPFWACIVDGRPAMGHAPWDPSPRTAAETANWYRFEDQPMGDGDRLDPLALLVMADMMPGSVFERIGRTEQRWFSPSIDLTVHLGSTSPHPGWVLAHNRAHWAGDGYASVESALWAPRPGARGAEDAELVAWGTQQIFFTPFPD